MFRAEMLDSAVRDLEQLDKPIARRIVIRIRWLAENFAQIKPEALTGDLAGLYKLRVGDYRVLYEIIPTEHVLLIHFIGHRSDIYRRR